MKMCTVEELQKLFLDKKMVPKNNIVMVICILENMMINF